MARILTVDDSNTIRAIVTKALVEVGLEVVQAEDGRQGLAKLAETDIDLVLLDVTMPVMDGIAMLQKVREAGDQTRVIMLTSESKKTLVASAMRLGIDDYIIKPFKPEELRAKVAKSLKTTFAAPAAELTPMPEAAPMASAPAASSAASSPSVPAAAAPAPAARPAQASGGRPGDASRQPADVLVVNDMENVHKKLRAVLPQNVTVSGATGAQQALAHCGERSFRVVLVDSVIPDVDSVALMNQMRALQPRASFVSLVLRTTHDAEAESRAHGYDGALFKPFDAAEVEDFLSRFTDQGDPVSADGNLVKVVAFSGREDRIERYFVKLRNLLRECFERVASACYDEAIVNLGDLPLRPDRTPRLVVDLEKEARRLGIGVRLVGTAETRKMLQGFAETAPIPFYASVELAQASAA